MTKKWWRAALIRAARTFAQGLVTLIGSEVINIVDLDWPRMLGMAATMAQDAVEQVCSLIDG